MISLLHPSLKRPDRSQATIEKWESLAGITDFEVIVCLDSTDPNLKAYQEIHRTRRVITMPNRNAVQAINYAASQAKGDIFIVVSDDTDCPENWGEQLLKAVEGKTDWIMKVPDGIQNWLITMPVMDRVYYNRFGYVYFPEYIHMFCDTEISCVADYTGRRIELNLPFYHRHYSTGQSPKDEVSIQADKTWEHGQKLFLERYKKSFDLPLKDIHGKIKSQDYINWINKKM